jgi:hypothetical protein
LRSPKNLDFQLSIFSHLLREWVAGIAEPFGSSYAGLTSGPNQT